MNRPRLSPRQHPLRATAVALFALMALLAAACVPPAVSPDPVVAIRMAPLGGEFFDMPWPSDSRLATDGTLDLDGLPGVDLLAGESPSFLRSQFPALIDEIGSSLEGFGVNTAAYFDSDLQLAPASLPTPSGSTSTSSPVMLLDLDNPGERVPVIVDFQATGDRNRPDGLLTVMPYPGHPLRESNRYAVAITAGVATLAGQPLAPSPLLADLDGPWDPVSGLTEDSWNLLTAQRDEVRGLLESTTSWSGSDLVAFAGFTTQDVDGDVAAVTGAVDTMAPPAVTITGQGPCSVDSSAGGTLTSPVVGTIELTRWLDGVYPYHDQGGEIVVGVDGLAVPQGSSAEEFTARFPCGPPPPDGWPLLTFIDGTGGHFDLSSSNPPLTYEGYAIAQIAPLYGVGRDIVITPLMAQLGISSAGEASNFTFYNFLNADAGRNNPIQQMAENLQLLQAMENLQLDGATLGTTGTVGTDSATQVASGHSQGSQTLPMVASVRPSLAAVVSSGAGAGQFHILSHNAGNRLFLGELTGDASALDELNPVIQVAQTMLEGSDGANYTSAMNYLHYFGHNDTCSPFEAHRHMAGATDLPLWNAQPPTSTYGDPAVDPTTAVLPASGNVAGSTRVSLELPGGHFVAHDQKSVTAGFLGDVAAGITPTVPATGYTVGLYSTQNCSGVRWDDPPTRFAR